MSQSAQVVPFGKYRGEPVEVLVADSDYCEWLAAQPWFREKHANIYQLVINYGGAPEDTPEHNQMQAAFLDDARCLRLATALRFNLGRQRTDRLYAGDEKARLLVTAFEDRLERWYEEAHVFGRRFEDGGWDVSFRVTPETLHMDAASFPTCSCGPCDHAADCYPESRCRGGETRYCRHEPCARRLTPTLDANLRDVHWIRDGHHDGCPWSSAAAHGLLEREWSWYPGDKKFLLELKPDLGDDYPAVLRQVTRYEHNGGTRCVVTRRHRFEQVTWEQVVTIFGSSGVWLLHEADLEAPEGADR